MKYDYFARKEEYGWLLYDTKDFSIKRVNFHYINHLGKYSSIRKINNCFIENSLSAPTKVFIDITDVCNLKCIHCHSDSKPQNTNKFSLDVLCDLIDQCYEMGVFVIKLSGGELFLYKEIKEVIRYIREKGMAVSMITNGTIMSEDIIETIQKYNVDIGISLDGNENTHDRIRGNGVYRKVLNSIHKLLDNNIKPAIQFTLMPDNVNDIEFMIELTKTLSIPLKVRRVKPLNRAIQNNLIISNNRKNYMKIVNLLSEYQHCEVEDVMKFNSTSSCDNLIHSLDCGAGTRVLSIRSNGDVLPCAFLGENFIGGNIYRDKIKAIWENSNNFKKVRNIKLSLKCLQCYRNDVCHGGCLAMSNFFTSDLSGGDPDCLNHVSLKQ